MSDHSVPHFKNYLGVAIIRVSAREFMCVGASPPFDHPHIFIDMGTESEAICPYCSTLFRYDASLHGGTDPKDCVFDPSRAAA